MQGGHKGDTTFCRGPEMKVKNWGGGVGRTVVSSPNLGQLRKFQRQELRVGGVFWETKAKEA